MTLSRPRFLSSLTATYHGAQPVSVKWNISSRARAVVPTAVEDHDLPAGRQMGQVPLHVHLRLLAIGRRGQGDDPEHAGTDALGDRLDHTALPGGVTALEHDADARTRRFHPLLQRDEFAVERTEQVAVLLVLHRWGGLVGAGRR